MKIRNGFVSNSSSSSFIIKKSDINEEQIALIKNYHAESIRLVKEGKARFDERNPIIPEGMSRDEYYDLPSLGYNDDDWSVRETDDYIQCGCIIDNFSMGTYVMLIGITKIEWLE